MKRGKYTSSIRLISMNLLAALCCSWASAADWPQWRGPNRDAKAADFKAPKTWPKELTQKWKVTVGEGVATPALVGDRLYVFSRQDGSEVLRCLNAADGKELWQDKYESLGASGPAKCFGGKMSLKPGPASFRQVHPSSLTLSASLNSAGVTMEQSLPTISRLVSKNGRPADRVRLTPPP